MMYEYTMRECTYKASYSKLEYIRDRIIRMQIKRTGYTWFLQGIHLYDLLFVFLQPKLLLKINKNLLAMGANSFLLVDIYKNNSIP